MKVISNFLILVALILCIAACKDNDPDDEIAPKENKGTYAFFADETYGKQFSYSDEEYEYSRFGSFTAEGMPDITDKIKIKEKGNDTTYVYVVKPDSQIDYFYQELNGEKLNKLFEFVYNGAEALVIVSEFDWVTNVKKSFATYDVSALYTAPLPLSVRVSKATGDCDVNKAKAEVKESVKVAANTWSQISSFAGKLAVVGAVVSIVTATTITGTAALTAVGVGVGIYAIGYVSNLVLDKATSWFSSAERKGSITKGSVQCSSTLPTDPDPEVPTDPNCNVLISCGQVDCNGDLNGTAIKDECDVCIGGATGKSACIVDCNGDSDGTAYLDDCDVCVGGNTGKDPCEIDCNGDLDGSAFIGPCGKCIGGNTNQNCDSLRIGTIY